MSRSVAMTAAGRRRRAVAMTFWRLLNPPTRPLAGWAPWWVLLETTGRRTGRPRRVPVANGLDGDRFWLISGLGDRAAYAHNLRADPRVRVKAPPVRLRDGRRARWRSGIAHPLPDDALARHRRLGRGRPGYRLDGMLLRSLGTGEEMLTCASTPTGCHRESSYGAGRPSAPRSICGADDNLVAYNADCHPRSRQTLCATCVDIDHAVTNPG